MDKKQEQSIVVAEKTTEPLNFKYNIPFLRNTTICSV